MTRSADKTEAARRRRGTGLPLEAKTELSAIGGRSVLALLDEQNLTIGARNLGGKLNYIRLTTQIRKAAGTADLHLFTAADPHDSATARRYAAMGYTVHTKEIRQVRLSGGGYGCDGNIANLFAFWAGVFAVRTDSLPDSTAQDLDARRNPDITANLEIGLDVLGRSLCPKANPRIAAASRRCASDCRVSPNFF